MPCDTLTPQLGQALLYLVARWPPNPWYAQEDAQLPGFDIRLVIVQIPV